MIEPSFPSLGWRYWDSANGSGKALSTSSSTWMPPDVLLNSVTNPKTFSYLLKELDRSKSTKQLFENLKAKIESGDLKVDQEFLKEMQLRT